MSGGRWPGVGIPWSGGSPAAGSVVIGVESNPTGRAIGASYGTAGSLYFEKNGIIATWPESANTCSISRLHGVFLGKATGAIKYAIYDSDKSLVAVTDQISVAWEADGSASERSALFASPPTITKGSRYYLGFVLSVNYAVNFAHHTDTEANVDRNTGGSFASPPASLVSNNVGHGFDYVLDMWASV